MAIGLKLRDVRRFGRKLERGIRTVGRGLAKGASFVEPFAAPIATAFGGPEAGVLTSKILGNVKALGAAGSKFTGKGLLKGAINIGEEELGRQQALRNARSIQSTM